MNEPWFKGQWNQFKGKIKETWGDLTDDDLDEAEGRRDILRGRIQERYGRSTQEAEQELSEWEDKLGLTST